MTATVLGIYRCKRASAIVGAIMRTQADADDCRFILAVGVVTDFLDCIGNVGIIHITAQANKNKVGSHTSVGDTASSDFATCCR